MQNINKSSGTTPTEKYLAKICNKTFLSLWSYPNLYTPEGRKNGKGAGKELCDLLVVFGNHVIIFSDKDILFNTNIDINIAWNRWRKKSIRDSANQLFGAEKWIKEKQTEIYLDKECTQKFPFEVDVSGGVKFHLIAVTKNSCAPAKRHFSGGSSGSFIIAPDADEKYIKNHPFVINDISPNKTFVHVFDEFTLDILFGELDTTHDFVTYLSTKEDAIRSNKFNFVAGEEDLIAFYLLVDGLVRSDPFDTDNPELAKQYDRIELHEGFWLDYVASPERKILKEANQVSYFWDDLIENFATHIFQGTVPPVSTELIAKFDNHVIGQEQAIRWMAGEGRFVRRMLAEQFRKKIQSTPHDRRSSIISFSPINKNTCFILVLFPRDKDTNYQSYREERLNFLYFYGLACKFKFPEAEKITLIGREPINSEGYSEEVLALRVDKLSEEAIEIAKEIIEELDILKNVQITPSKLYLIPRLDKKRTTKTGRNEKCPCRSGLKYKKCCLLKINE